MTNEEFERQHRQHPDHAEVDDLGWLRHSSIGTVPSVRDQALFPGENHILGIVWHYTDTRSVGSLELAKRIRDAPRAGQRSASWHLCIDRTGAAVQSVSALRGSWHAGGSTAARFAVAGMEAGHRVWGMSSPSNRAQPGANALFFGIELENVGELRLVREEWLGWPFIRGSSHGEPISVPEDEVFVHANGKAWHSFTDAQVATSSLVVSALALKYALVQSNCSFSHQMIDTANRTDPGPVWMGVHLPSIFSTVFGNR